jgi:hypothetical protein
MHSGLGSPVADIFDPEEAMSNMRGWGALAPKRGRAPSTVRRAWQPWLVAVVGFVWAFPLSAQADEGDRGRPGPLLLVAALQAIDDVPHTGILAGVQVGLRHSLALEPHAAVGLGDQYVAYLARISVSYEQVITPPLAAFVSGGYGVYGERSRYAEGELNRTAPGPVLGVGVTWLPSGRVGARLSVTSSRVRFSGDAFASPFTTSINHLYLGLVMRL